MNVLVTGAAGFIGFHLVKELVQHGYFVVGIDNINNYYEVDLKYNRLNQCGIARSEIALGKVVNSEKWSNFKFAQMDIENRHELESMFESFRFEKVIHLAAQAGVRYSLENPQAYINSNIIGYFNILDLCRISNVERLLYASSSSVYGLTNKEIFEETDITDTPASLYAATKKSNELLAHSYSHLYNLKTIGLRFFTVYGPWGRPDMAPFLFSKAIVNGQRINVFNSGKMKRDFTYIDDIVNGLILLLEAKTYNNYNIFNIGNNSPVNLMDFIKCLEKEFGVSAKLNMCDMQPGDVVSTWANVNHLNKYTNYIPKTSISEGVKKFVTWYKKYYKI
jgi:UDP-glucuronate 4-epimerase